MRTYYNITCCSRSSRVCGKVENHYFITIKRKKTAEKNVERFVENLLNC
nr:MAG TPA: hypothetical protein [Microviridae sp.]